MPDELLWTEDARAALLALARAAAPRECAALLGGHRDGGATCITDVEALANRAAGDDAFAVGSREFLRAEGALAARGLTFLGFAHSHPRGAAAPSARDRAELWTGCVQLITDGSQVRAFWLDERRAVRPLPLGSAEAAR